MCVADRRGPVAGVLAANPPHACTLLVGGILRLWGDRRRADCCARKRSHLWSELIAITMIAISYRVMWAGVRYFEGRSTPLPLTLAGALAWLVASQFEAFYQSS